MKPEKKIQGIHTLDLKEENKKKIARTIRELYLYPNRSKAENLLRGIVWMLSWIIGIAVQNSIDQHLLSGAYFIFAASMLLEFAPESRTQTIPRFIHGIFCFFLCFILIGATYNIFNSPNSGNQTPKWLHYFFSIAPRKCGWIVFGMVLIAVLLAVIEVHKFFFDEEAITKQELEKQQEEERRRFINNLFETKIEEGEQ